MKLTIELDWPVWMNGVGKIVIPLLAITVAGAALAVPKTFAPGQTLTAADLNDDFNEVESRLSTLEAPVGARYHLVTAQVLRGEAFPAIGKAVNYDTKDYDGASAATPGVNWAFKVPADGTYLVTASLFGNCPTCDGTNAFATLRLVVNDTWDFDENALDTRYDWATGNMSLAGSDVVALKKDDTVSVRFTENLVGSTFTAASGAVSFTRIGGQ
jgi:hypothetical protein